MKDINELRVAWKAGLASGDAGEIDFAVLKKEARMRLTAANTLSRQPVSNRYRLDE